MKKALLLLPFILFACSSNDDNNEQETDNDFWRLTLETECDNNATSFSFCITEENYEEATSSIIFNEPCNWIEAIDIDGNTREGYFGMGINICE